MHEQVIYVSYVTDIGIPVKKARNDCFSAQRTRVTMLPTEALLPLLLFILLLFLLALYALAASGHFPRQHRAPTLASGAGFIVLYGSMVIAILCLAADRLGFGLIPWYQRSSAEDSPSSPPRSGSSNSPTVLSTDARRC